MNGELQCEKYGKNYGGIAETTVDSTASLDWWFSWAAEKGQI